MTQQQIVMTEPRDMTRMVYGNAIRSAVTQQERDAVLVALNWYELKWRAIDQQAQAAQQQSGSPQGAPPAADKPPREPSAVEQYGADSPQAEAVREARREARKQAKAEKVEEAGGDA